MEVVMLELLAAVGIIVILNVILNIISLLLFAVQLSVKKMVMVEGVAYPKFKKTWLEKVLVVHEKISLYGVFVGIGLCAVKAVIYGI